MPTPPTNHPHGNGEGPGERAGGLAEILAEAEELRRLLQDAGGRLARLIAALKQQRQHSRAVEAAMASLRRLRLTE